jgi:hypothetical protein
MLPRPPAPSRCPPGPGVAWPCLSAGHTRVTRAHHRPGADAGRPSCPPPCSGPLILSRSCPPHGAHPLTPSLASPATISKGADRRAALSSLSLPRSPPPTATRASHAPFLFTRLIHAAGRVDAVPGAFLTATVAVPPPLPHGETRQSTTISLFEATLTSLIHPCSSRS